MLKLDENYSDYVDMDNPDYPEGAAKNASSSESYDGTPLLASFMNNIVGAFQGMWKKAYGDTKGISGSADTVDESQFVNAIEKFAKDMVKAHADLRGENAHGAKSTADPGQIVARDIYGNSKFGVPLENDDAARRGDIYDLTKGVLCITPAENFAKEIPAEKFPGFKLNNETVVKVLFQSGCEKATEEFDEETDIFTLNFCETGAKKVFAKKDGEIILLGNHVIDNKTKVFQSYTEMELMYLTSLDEGNGGWLVLNNPIVLSKSDATSGYTVLADGEKVYNNASSITSDEILVGKYQGEDLYRKMVSKAGTPAGISYILNSFPRNTKNQRINYGLSTMHTGTISQSINFINSYQGIADPVSVFVQENNIGIVSSGEWASYWIFDIVIEYTKNH